jgi:hypothetical protein
VNDLEHKEQVALFEWAKLAQNVYPVLKWMYAIPNGGHRHIAVAAKLKAEGVKSGVPDVCLPVPKNGFGALYIEMKAGKNKPTINQIEWEGGLNEIGNKSVTCWGWEAAKTIIEEYLK